MRANQVDEIVEAEDEVSLVGGEDVAVAQQQQWFVTGVDELQTVGGGGDALTQTTGIFFTPGGTAMDSGEASSIGEQTQELVRKLPACPVRLDAVKRCSTESSSTRNSAFTLRSVSRIS